jgi:nicotinate-nucleotide adenylyltransferase
MIGRPANVVSITHAEVADNVETVPMSKLCLGGSFNPIHHGHLICARAAAGVIGASGIVLIPTAIPPHKQANRDLALAADRLQMCKLAVAGTKDFATDDREIRRGGASYTIQTVHKLKGEGWDQVAWLIGSDMLGILPQWHQAQELLREVRFVIMARPGWNFDWDSLPAAYQHLKAQVVEVPQIDISATEIRRRVKSRIPIDFLTPPAVVEYIRDRKLYL